MYEQCGPANKPRRRTYTVQHASFAGALEEGGDVLDEMVAPFKSAVLALVFLKSLFTGAYVCTSWGARGSGLVFVLPGNTPGSLG